MPRSVLWRMGAACINSLAALENSRSERATIDAANGAGTTHMEILRARVITRSDRP